MFSKFRTRAATRALTGVVVVGAVLGVAFGAVCLTPPPARPSATHAAAFARAAQSGYAAAHAVATAPVARSQTMPRQIVAADRPSTSSPRDLDCLAAAVYYEARGESASGQAAVAQVVLNRLSGRTYPKSVCGVVYQGLATGECQFSFACDGAMHGRREPRAWVRAREVAARALAGYVMTAIGKATCFHATHMALGAAAGGGVRLGGHIFFTAFNHGLSGRARAAAPVVGQDAERFALAQEVAAAVKETRAASPKPSPTPAPVTKTAT